MKANQFTMFLRDEEGVSEIVGNILLIAITVVMAAAMGGLIFAVAKPVENVAATVAAQIDPGDDGWGNGDESLVLTHGGGDSIDAKGASLRYTIDGDATTLKGASALGSAFADGKFTIGERWTLNLTLPPSVVIDMQFVVDTGESSQVVAAVSTTSDCSGDSAPPSVDLVSQNPSDVTSGTTGSVTIEVTLEDACQGVDTSVTPHLEYRFEDGTDNAYTDAGAMLPNGTNQWKIVVSGLTFSIHADEQFEYRLNPVTDLGGCCSGPSSPAFSELIDDLSQFTPFSSVAAVAGLGTVGGSTSMHDDDAVTGSLTEVGHSGTATIYRIAGTTPSGTAADTSHATAVNESGTGATTDYTIYDTSGETAVVTGFPNPGASAIQAVWIGFEGQKGGSGGTSPTYRVQFTATGCSDGSPPGPFNMDSTTDVTYIRNVTANCPSWTASNVWSSLTVTVTCVTRTNKDLWVDQVFVMVKYAAQVYNLTVQYNFPQLPTANVTSHTLQIDYQTATEDFAVQAWNGVTWASKSPNLFVGLGNPTKQSYSLTGNEITGGVGGTGPKIRITDTVSTNTSPNTLLLDYVRIKSS